MLSGYQCEVIAYIGEGEYICRECALKDYSTVTLEKLDLGLTCVASRHLTPLIRYCIDESASERTYEEARYRVDRFVDEHPQLHALLALNSDRRWTLTDRWASRHEVPECCGCCGEPIK